MTSSRRRLLATTALGLVAPLAGCSDPDDSGGGDASGGDDEDDETDRGGGY